MPGRTTIDTFQEAAWIKWRREELGRFLRERREQLRPAERGDSASNRRRVRGLRRDEVAVLADIGLSWYTMLEQGRVQNVSRHTLAAVSRALLFSGSEREYVFTLAARSFAELDIDDSAPPAALISFVQAATVGMVFVLSPLFEVVAYNLPADRFFRFSAHGPHANLLRIMLSDRQMPGRFIRPTWAAVLASMVGNFRLWFARIGGPSYDTLIEELRTFPQFASAWDRARVYPPPCERALLMLPQRGPLLFNVMAFTTPVCPTYTLITKTHVSPDLADVQSPQGAVEPAGRAPAVLVSGARRRELGAYLRSRREGLSPEQVGLRTLGNRRTKGLRRQEVAQCAGIGASWYGTLEQGRVENLTPMTLWAVACALKLTHRERQYLKRLSGQSFGGAEGIDGEASADLLCFVREFPDAHAHFFNANLDVLAWNADADEFYEYSRWEHPNLLRTMWGNPRLRRAFVDPTWEESLRRILAHYRYTAAALEAPGKPSIIADLVRESAEFARIWRSDRSVGNPGMEEETVEYPRGGRRRVQVLLLTPTSLPTHTLVLKINADPRRPGPRRSCGPRAD